MMKKQEKGGAIVAEIILFLLLLGLVVVIIIVTSGNTTTISSEGDLNSKLSAMVCTTSQNLDGPFYFNDASKVKHEIKIVLDEKKVDSFYYIFEGTFSTSERAENAIVTVHANYDLDLGNNNVANKPESHFTYVNKVGRININAGIKDINTVTGKYLLLDETTSNNIKARSSGEIKKYYEGLGFSCKNS